MASTPVINLRKGHAVRHNGDVCVVIAHELKTPPRMASYVIMSVRSVATKKVSNLRLTSNDSMESVMLERIPHEYSYRDAAGDHFLHTETFDDVIVPSEIIDGVKDYLLEGQTYTLLFADGAVADIELPQSMEMQVAEAPEGVKGDSANNSNKTITMETGLVVQAPLFINPGDRLLIKTEDGSYMGRA
jgi:elongation factor P